MNDVGSSETPSGDAEQALLTRAVRLATENAEAGQLPFAALVVRAGVVVATEARARLTSHDLPATGRLIGVGSLDQILADLGALAQMSAEYILLDPSPDHPRDELPLAEDWRNLETIAKHAVARLR